MRVPLKPSEQGQRAGARSVQKPVSRLPENFYGNICRVSGGRGLGLCKVVAALGVQCLTMKLGRYEGVVGANRTRVKLTNR